MCIKLIGLDLDQTLLNSSQDISPATVAALAEAHRQGIIIVPTTGRPKSGLPDALKKLPFIQYCITSNGASIWQLPDGRKIGSNTIPPEIFIPAARIIESDSLIAEYFTAGKGYESVLSFQNTMQLFSDPWIRDYFIRSRTPVENIMEMLLTIPELEEFAVQFSSTAQKENVVDKLLRSFELKISNPGSCYIEITSINAGKGAALRQLSEMLGIQKEEVMVFGDSDNDMDMFLFAGLPVAMGNASEHLKKKSCYITADCDHDGVALAVRKFCARTEE